MTRLKVEKSISSAGWRRLLRLAILLPATFDLIRHHGGSDGIVLSRKEFGSILPSALAISRDQTNFNNHPPSNQQHRHPVTNNFHESCVEPSHVANNVSFDTRSGESTKAGLKRRQAIQTIFARIFGKSQAKKKETERSLKEATRLVGGANHNVEAEQDPQQQDNSTLNSPSDLSSDGNQLKKSALKSILPKSKRFFVSKESEETVRRRLQQTFSLTQKVSSQAGPSLVTVLTLLLNSGMKDEISLVNLYTLALLGASCGFHLFLHFITLGYALGVTLPLIFALNSFTNQYELPLPTILHTLITICWGIRLFSFLTIREYSTWPSLHQKVVEVQAKMKIPFASKILCWFLYSFFYLTLVASCWSRLLQSSSSKGSWGILGYTGLSLQFVGLSLETIADLQKNSFKTRNRLSWCNVGVWKYSTHPNYLGEGMFWWGTYLAHGFHQAGPSVLATVGLVTILYVLKGAAKSLSSKQKEKYGLDMDFYQFQRTHNVFGPKRIWSRQQTVEAADASQSTKAMTDNYDTSASVSNDGNLQELNQ